MFQNFSYKIKYKKNRSWERSGFTFVELMMVILIMGILSTIGISSFSDARQRNRDSSRISDISQIQIALSAYYSDHGVYPTVITAGQKIMGTGVSTTTVYMSKVPTPPSAQDGTCGSYPVYSSYYYVPSNDYKNYCLYFCLGDNTAELTGGAKIAMPKGIINDNPVSHQCPF